MWHRSTWSTPRSDRLCSSDRRQSSRRLRPGLGHQEDFLAPPGEHGLEPFLGHVVDAGGVDVADAGIDGRIDDLLERLSLVERVPHGGRAETQRRHLDAHATESPGGQIAQRADVNGHRSTCRRTGRLFRGKYITSDHPADDARPHLLQELPPADTVSFHGNASPYDPQVSMHDHLLD